MIVRIPSVLRSYTNGKKEVEGEGNTVNEVFVNLDKQFPGIRFRFINEQNGIREHMRIFLNREEIESLDQFVQKNDEIFIIQALSGG